jgi:hypothetical protein
MRQHGRMAVGIRYVLLNRRKDRWSLSIAEVPDALACGPLQTPVDQPLEVAQAEVQELLRTAYGLDLDLVWEDRGDGWHAADGNMPAASEVSATEPLSLLPCEATRWVGDEPQPGWIEVQLKDVDGRTWRFFDKPVIFEGGAEISSSTAFPVAVAIPVRIVDGVDVVTVSTDPQGIESEEGESTFRVVRSALAR